MLHSPIHVGGGAEQIPSCSRLRIRHWHPVSSGSTPGAEPDQPAPADVPLGIGNSVTVFAAIHR